MPRDFSYYSERDKNARTDVVRDKYRNPVLGEDDLPILYPDDAYIVLASLSRAVSDRALSFDAFTTDKALFVTVYGERETHALVFDPANRNGFDERCEEDIVDVLGAYGLCSAARQQQHEEAA